MKRLLHIILVLFIGVQMAAAQQKPQYTQYIFNTLLINPAVAGIENYTDVKAGYRSQWTGLQGAPITSYLTVDFPLGDKFIQGDANGMPTDADDPAGRSYLQNYVASEPHHGLGFNIVSDVAGPITTTNVDINYAYHLGLTDKINLALGVAAGANHISLNTAEITLENPNDPAIYNGNNSQWTPDLSAGVWMYSSTFFAGASVQQLLPGNLYFSSTHAVDQSKTVPQYFVTAGVKLFLSDDLSLLPSFLIKDIEPVPLTFDINAKLNFKDKFWIGGSYRHGDSFGALAGFNISSFLNVCYSYDVTTSALNTVSNGTHEIVLILLLNNRYNVTSASHGF